MKKLLIFLCLLICSCKDNSSNLKEGTIEVRFSPKGGITSAIVSRIDESEDNVKVCAFAFTSTPIAEALIKAHKNGRNVEAVLDRENLYNKNSVLRSLYDNGINVYIDSSHAIMHNKVILIDDRKIFSGSFNLSKGAEEHNAENNLFIVDRNLASQYIENYNLHKAHSKLYSPDIYY